MLDRRLLLRGGPNDMHKALQLALEIYARVPLIPQSLFMGELEIQIDDKDLDLDIHYNGTLAGGKHKTKAMFWVHSYGIFVCYPHFLAWCPGGNV
jgi:hypothetical protein